MFGKKDEERWIKRSWKIKKRREREEIGKRDEEGWIQRSYEKVLRKRQKNVICVG